MLILCFSTPLSSFFLLRIFFGYMLVSCCFPKSVAWRIERQSCVICGRRNGLNVLCARDVFDIHDEFEDDVQVIEFSFF